MEDDMYNGMFIPKGAFIFGNIWAMVRNEADYPNADEFVPERFASATPPPDPRQFVFGFGRRRCPGMHLVDSALWLLLASMLATMDISCPTDPQTGEPIKPSVTFDNAVFRMPSSFAIDVRPRSERAAALYAEDESE
jgi:cytochrome P450